MLFFYNFLYLKSVSRKEYLNAPPISKNMSSEKKNNEGARDRILKLYTLEVYLIEGPFIEEVDGVTISHIIQIRGDQNLVSLHSIIYRAFDRYDEHLYEFLLGEGPDDRSAIYSLPMDSPIPGFEEKMAGDVRSTTLDSLGLEPGRAFGYEFDFGAGWLHQIDVIAIEDSPGKGTFPKIIENVGKNPPQYPDDED